MAQAAHRLVLSLHQLHGRALPQSAKSGITSGRSVRDMSGLRQAPDTLKRGAAVLVAPATTETKQMQQTADRLDMQYQFP